MQAREHADTAGLRHLVACPRPFEQAEQTALAFWERQRLTAYVTGFTWPRGALGRAAGRVLSSALGPAVERALRLRMVQPLPNGSVVAYPTVDVGRTLASAVAWRGIEDRLWERDDHRFARLVARRALPVCDVVHGTEHASLELFEAAKACGRATVLHVSSVHPLFHDAIFDREYARHPEMRDSIAWRLRERRRPRDERRVREYGVSDLIVTGSRFSHRSLTANGVASERVVIVPLGAAPASADATREAPARTGALRALFAGKVSFHKGCHVLLEAWRALESRDAVLRLAGRDELPRRFTSQRGVEAVGSVPQARLFSLMDDSDLLVMPTLCDTFGMVIAEALMRGLPVLTTENAGAADLVVEGLNGWIVPAGDVAALADRLRWCEAHLDEVRGMRPRVRAASCVRTWTDYRADLTAALQRRGLL